MPKINDNIKVIKVPLAKPSIDYQQIFPRMPRLYLELLENKAKIKQDLINKEYIPSSNVNIHNSGIEEHSIDVTTSNHRSVSSSSSKKGGKESGSGSDKKDSKSDIKKFESRLDMLLSDNDDFNDDDSIEEKSIASTVSTSKNKNINRHDRHDRRDRDRHDDKDSVSSKDSLDSVVFDKKNHDDDNSSTDGSSSGGSSIDSNDSDELEKRLNKLLNEDDSGDNNRGGDSLSDKRSIGVESVVASVNKYSRHRDMDGRSVQYKSVNQAPTLAELEAKGGYIPRRELRDINNPTMSEQQEEDAKRELLFKFDLLRKSYPNSIIPEYTIHTDFQTIKKSYDDTVRRLSLDSSVESYKTYLIYGFMACEFIFGNFLGFDMQGFTSHQLSSINSYEKLLIELGEKSYVPSGSKWPVELRLLFMIIMNAAFFIVSKMIMKKTGANILNMVSSMNSSQNHSTTQNPMRKRKMRGPNIDLNDIPDVDTQ